MSKAKFHVKRGDTVQVISGNHRGSSGRILQVLPEKAQVIIEGVRLIKKHQRKTQDNPNGAIVEREGPIHISNVKTRRARQFGKGQGKKEGRLKSATDERRFTRIRMGTWLLRRPCHPCFIRGSHYLETYGYAIGPRAS